MSQGPRVRPHGESPSSERWMGRTSLRGGQDPTDDEPGNGMSTRPAPATNGAAPAARPGQLSVRGGDGPARRERGQDAPADRKAPLLVVRGNECADRDASTSTRAAPEAAELRSKNVETAQGHVPTPFGDATQTQTQLDPEQDAVCVAGHLWSGLSHQCEGMAAAPDGVASRRAMRSAIPDAIGILDYAIAYLGASPVNRYSAEKSRGPIEWALGSVPWDSMRELFGLSDERLASLKAGDFLSVNSKDKTIASNRLITIRGELEQARADEPSSSDLVGRLLPAVYKIGAATLVGALVGAPLGALAAGESIADEMVKGVIQGLVVGVALEFEPAVTGRVKDADPHRVAHRATTELVEALTAYNQGAAGGQARHVNAATTRLAVAVLRVQLATLKTEWRERDELLDIVGKLLYDLSRTKGPLDLRLLQLDVRAFLDTMPASKSAALRTDTGPAAENQARPEAG